VDETSIRSPFDQTFGFDFTANLMKSDGSYLSTSGGIDPPGSNNYNNSIQSHEDDSGVATENNSFDESSNEKLNKLDGNLTTFGFREWEEFSNLKVVPLVRTISKMGRKNCQLP